MLKPGPSRRLLRTRQAAEYLSISRKKLRQLIQGEELPVVIVGEGAPWLLDVDDLNDYIRRHKQMGTL